LNRAFGDDQRLVLSAPTPERRLGTTERRQVVRHLADLLEVHSEDGAREWVLAEEAELGRGRAFIRVIALSDVEDAFVGVQRHAVGGMVGSRARQAAHEIQLRPAGFGSSQPGDHAGVRVALHRQVRADPWVA
jgi:hypothetical protein